MGNTLKLRCPHCYSHNVVRNGHHHQGKIQFLCTKCHKYFYEDSAKGFPPTSIPFPVIAYLLYYRKNIPIFSKSRFFKPFVGQWIKILHIRDTDISWHTLNHWIKNYEAGLENVISFNEARDYVHDILSKDLKGVPKEIIRAKSHPYKLALRFLEHLFSRSFCVDLARRDPVFFNDLVDIVSKQELYCYRLAEKLRKSIKNLFFKGVLQ